MHTATAAVVRRVLLAEMDPAGAQILATVLRSNGYEAVLSEATSEARQRLSGEQFGTIISDWNEELLRSIRPRTTPRAHCAFSQVVVYRPGGHGRFAPIRMNRPRVGGRWTLERSPVFSSVACWS